MTNHNSSLIRPKAIEEHSLCSQDYLIATDAISLAWQQLDKALRRRTGGLIVWGQWRIGKSSAIKYLQKVAESKYPGLRSAILDGETKLYISERDFFADLCKELNAPTNGSSGDCKRRAVESMIKKGGMNAKRLFLLFIDEPHKWTDLQINWVCEVYDKLERVNVRLITVMVGQRTLMTTRENYIARGNGVVIDRLMRQVIEFYGVRDVEELKVVLDGYDTITEADSDWPFTRFFFPIAYASGFRLRESAEVIWDAFMQAIVDHGEVTECPIPMKHLTLLVEAIFEDYHGNDATDFSINKAFAKELIEDISFSLYLDTLAGRSKGAGDD